MVEAETVLVRALHPLLEVEFMARAPIRGRGRVNRKEGTLRRRAMALLHRDGPFGLVKGLLRHARVQLERVVYVGDFYVYRYPVPEVDPDVNRPRVDSLEVRILDSLDDIKALAAAGYEDPGRWVGPAERRLAAGAVAVCG